jgi:enterochelin esterase-like enzyme
MTFTPVPPTLTPTATVWTCTEAKGQVVDLSFTSKIENAKVAYRVYLPPCYTSTSRRYPYVILMHGSDGDQTYWTDTLNVQDALDTGITIQALPPMILVMPNGGQLMNNNIFKDGASWESLILNELMPEIEKSLCVWDVREGRAIGGISRGGFWAYEIALRHPEMFSAVGGHSAFFDTQLSVGPAYNPLVLAKTAQFTTGLTPRFWLDAGQDDYARPNIEVFQKTLAGRGIDPGYTLNPVGKHESKYWASHVSEYLSFYGQTWPRNIEELPTCLQ